MIKDNFFLFHPIYCLYKRHPVLFYREHMDFFLHLFKYIFDNKYMYFKNRDQFIHLVFDMISNYILQNSIKKDINIYFKKIIESVIIFGNKKNFDVYSYLFSFVTTMLFLSYYHISVLSIAHLNQNEKSIHIDIVNIILKKYEMQPKLIVCVEDKNLIKGVTFHHTNNVVDLSLKKIYELINNKIDTI